MPKQAGSTHISTWLLAAGYHHGPGWEVPKLNASEMAVYLDTLDTLDTLDINSEWF